MSKYMIKRLLRPFKPVLLPLKNFLDNMLYLFKYNINEKNISTESLHYYLDNIKYEIGDDLRNITRPEIEDPVSTLKRIIKDKLSVSRFGDGEFELLEGKSIGFQSNSALLKDRLQEILKSDQQDILICIPHYFWYSVKDCNLLIKEYTRKTICYRRADYEKMLLKNKKYYATEFTQLYMTYNADVDLSNYFEHLKLIWFNQDITLIQGLGITKDFTFNIFEHAKSIEYRYAPSKDAFSDYNAIIEDAKTIDKSRLILIILGPTATVLAYDLAMLGYWAIDIGHTAKDFEFYKKKIKRDSKNIKKFYAPD